MFSQRTISHISSKFNNKISKIAQTMIDDAQKSTLGREVLREHKNLRGSAKLAGNLSGDVAILSLNQKLVELEQLTQMQSTQGSESDFNEY